MGGNKKQKRGNNLDQGSRVLLWVNRAGRGGEDETVRGQCIPVAAEFIVGECMEMDGGLAA